MRTPISYFYRKDPCKSCMIKIICNLHCNEKTDFISTDHNRIDAIYILGIIIMVLVVSMIDISDGLSSELLHLCTQSGKGCRVYERKLPVHEQTKAMAKEFNLDYTTCVMNGGEDYELLFTIPASKFKLIQNNPLITEIGFITNEEEGMYLEAKDCSMVGIIAQGWNSLLKE